MPIHHVFINDGAIYLVVVLVGSGNAVSSEGNFVPTSTVARCSKRSDSLSAAAVFDLVTRVMQGCQW